MTPPPSRLPSWAPAFALGVGVLCISCSAIFVKNAHLPGTTTAFYRVAFALVGSLPLWFMRRTALPPRATLVPIAIGGAAFAIELILWQAALTTTTAANATLLVNLSPIWVGLGALVFLGERQPVLFWMGTALAFAGMAVIALRGAGGWHGLSAGDGLAATGSVFYAISIIVTRGQRHSLDTVRFLVPWTAASCVVAFAACLLWHAPLGGFRADQWGNLLAVGLVSHLAGYLAISFALGHIRAARVAITLLAQPILTALLAHWALGEPLTVAVAIGGAIALAGLALALAPPRRRAA